MLAHVYFTKLEDLSDLEITIGNEIDTKKTSLSYCIPVAYPDAINLPSACEYTTSAYKDKIMLTGLPYIFREQGHISQVFLGKPKNKHMSNTAKKGNICDLDDRMVNWQANGDRNTDQPIKIAQ